MALTTIGDKPGTVHLVCIDDRGVARSLCLTPLTKQMRFMQFVLAGTESVDSYGSDGTYCRSCVGAAQLLLRIREARKIDLGQKDVL